ncbi:unnamed protein product, partial [Phaeothamnion confervicola]
SIQTHTPSRQEEMASWLTLQDEQLSGSSNEEDSDVEGETREALEARIHKAYEAALRLQSSGAAGSDAWRRAGGGYVALLEEPALAEPGSLSRLRFLCLKNLGAVREAQGDADAALALYVAAADLDGSDVALWLRVASRGQAAGHFRLARLCLEQVLTLEPDHLAALRALASILEELGDVAAATAVARRLLSLDPWDATARVVAMRLAQRGPFSCPPPAPIRHSPRAESAGAGAAHEGYDIGGAKNDIVTMAAVVERHLHNPSWASLGQLLLRTHAELSAPAVDGAPPLAARLAVVVAPLPLPPWWPGPPPPESRRPEVAAAWKAFNDGCGGVAADMMVENDGTGDNGGSGGGSGGGAGGGASESGRGASDDGSGGGGGDSRIGGAASTAAAGTGGADGGGATDADTNAAEEKATPAPKSSAPAAGGKGKGRAKGGPASVRVSARLRKIKEGESQKLAAAARERGLRLQLDLIFWGWESAESDAAAAVSTAVPAAAPASAAPEALAGRKEASNGSSRGRVAGESTAPAATATSAPAVDWWPEEVRWSVAEAAAGDETSDGSEKSSRKDGRVVPEMALAARLLAPWSGSSEEACARCDDGGTLLCCDFCPTVWHDRCLEKSPPPLVAFACEACCAEAAALEATAAGRAVASRYDASAAPVLRALLEQLEGGDGNVFDAMRRFLEALAGAGAAELALEDEPGAVAAATAATAGAAIDDSTGDVVGVGAGGRVGMCSAALAMEGLVRTYLGNSTPLSDPSSGSIGPPASSAFSLGCELTLAEMHMYAAAAAIMAGRAYREDAISHPPASAAAAAAAGAGPAGLIADFAAGREKSSAAVKRLRAAADAHGAACDAVLPSLTATLGAPATAPALQVRLWWLAAQQAALAGRRAEALACVRECGDILRAMSTPPTTPRAATAQTPDFPEPLSLGPELFAWAAPAAAATAGIGSNSGRASAAPRSDGANAAVTAAAAATAAGGGGSASGARGAVLAHLPGGPQVDAAVVETQMAALELACTGESVRDAFAQALADFKGAEAAAAAAADAAAMAVAKAAAGAVAAAAAAVAAATGAAEAAAAETALLTGGAAVGDIQAAMMSPPQGDGSGAAAAAGPAAVSAAALVSVSAAAPVAAPAAARAAPPAAAPAAAQAAAPAAAPAKAPAVVPVVAPAPAVSAVAAAQAAAHRAAALNTMRGLLDLLKWQYLGKAAMPAAPENKGAAGAGAAAATAPGMPVMLPPGRAGELLKDLIRHERQNAVVLAEAAAQSDHVCDVADAATARAASKAAAAAAKGAAAVVGTTMAGNDGTAAAPAAAATAAAAASAAASAAADGAAKGAVVLGNSTTVFAMLVRMALLFGEAYVALPVVIGVLRTLLDRGSGDGGGGGEGGAGADGAEPDRTSENALVEWLVHVLVRVVAAAPSTTLAHWLRLAPAAMTMAAAAAGAGAPELAGASAAVKTGALGPELKAVVALLIHRAARLDSKRLIGLAMKCVKLVVAAETTAAAVASAAASPTAAAASSGGASAGGATAAEASAANPGTMAPMNVLAVRCLGGVLVQRRKHQRERKKIGKPWFVLMLAAADALATLLPMPPTAAFLDGEGGESTGLGSGGSGSGAGNGVGSGAGAGAGSGLEAKSRATLLCCLSLPQQQDLVAALRWVFLAQAPTPGTRRSAKTFGANTLLRVGVCLVPMPVSRRVALVQLLHDRLGRGGGGGGGGGYDSSDGDAEMGLCMDARSRFAGVVLEYLESAEVFDACQAEDAVAAAENAAAADAATAAGAADSGGIQAVQEQFESQGPGAGLVVSELSVSTPAPQQLGSASPKSNAEESSPSTVHYSVESPQDAAFTPMTDKSFIDSAAAATPRAPSPSHVSGGSDGGGRGAAAARGPAEFATPAPRRAGSAGGSGGDGCRGGGQGSDAG